MEYKIIVAGIGPGNPDYMVPEARRVIESARVLAGGRRALSQFAGENVQEQCVIGADIPAVMAFIRKNLQHDDVVVMVSGDPGYYSLLDALRREFPAESLRVIPGISAMQLAFARLAYAPGRLAGMLTDGKYNSHTIPQLLMENGWPGETGLAVCSRLSYEDETIIRTTLAEAGKHPVFSHCILVVTA